MIRPLSTVALVVFALGASARAESNELEKFVEAHQAGDWKAAETAWRSLASETRPTAIELKHVDVLLHLGERALARTSVEDVLGREPTNVVALVALARLDATDSAGAAKELLLRAAQEGYPVLRELGSAKELASLHDDPAFVLAAMHASSRFEAREKTRNPFAAPRLSPPAPEPRRPNITKPVSHEAPKRLADYIAQGNALLVAMAKDLRDEKLAEVSQTLLDVKALGDEMRREQEPDFTRVADELVRRAEALDAEARKLQKIKDLGIVVTGVVVAKESGNKTIVTLAGGSGAIYEEGDELRDAHGERIRGLKVARIVEGSVSFRYDEVSFVRELRIGR